MNAAAVTPSMRATSGYFVVVTLLFVAQVLLGIVTAHYAVEGQGLYGLPLSDLFPYSVTRTWHTQLAVLWIATAWLGTGLYVAPLLGGREPRFQAAGVWFLLVSLVVIVAGSFAGEWLAINRMIADADAKLLVRPPGLRVRGSRSVLANLPVRRTAALGRARAARPVAGAAAAAGWPLAARSSSSSRRSRSGCCSEPASCTARTRTSRSWSTGAGGSCTFGSKASSRFSRPRSCPRCSCAWGSCGFRWRPHPCSSRRSSFSAAACSARSIISIGAGRRSA